MSTTFILKFRDLNTDKGETVRLHQEIINDSERGCTWWGWWHKLGETVPTGRFRYFLRQIENNGSIDVYLFDSGTFEVFKATVVDIKWDHRIIAIRSPNQTLTPEYYRSRTCLAWFEIRTIEREPNGAELLRTLSYVRADESFDPLTTLFNDFDNKQISSPNELKHQDRTIWFVRSKRDTDASHEIVLYDASRTPSHFPTEPILTRSRRIIWLSDPHFSVDCHEFALEGSIHRKTLLQALQEDLRELRATEVAGLVISGDITWRGISDEFAFASRFIHGLAEWANLKPRSVLICPGNHDLEFSTEPFKKNVPVTANKAVEFLCCGRRFLIRNAYIVEIASLNSSVLEQKKDVFQGHGYVTDRQMDMAAEEMGWNETTPDSLPVFRIVMLHHHLVPILYREIPIADRQASVVYDSGALCRWIVKHRVNLVLHGHMHQATVIREARSNDMRGSPTPWHEFYIAALGSSGVVNRHTSDRKNSYGILEFGPESLVLSFRQITAEGSVAYEQREFTKVEIPLRVP